MAVGRHFEKGFIAITQLGIIWFQRNLVCSRKLRFQGRSHDEVAQFANSTWQTDARMKIVFGYIWTIYFLINAKFRTKEHYTQTQITWPKYSGSRHLNRDNKTANIVVTVHCSKKTVVYLRLITVKWHIENSKNNEWWYYFRSTMTLAKCCWSNITVHYFFCFRCVISLL